MQSPIFTKALDASAKQSDSDSCVCFGTSFR